MTAFFHLFGLLMFAIQNTVQMEGSSPEDITIHTNKPLRVNCNNSDEKLSYAWTLKTYESGDEKTLATNHANFEKDIPLWQKNIDQSFTLFPNGTLYANRIFPYDSGTLRCYVFPSKNQNSATQTFDYSLIVLAAPELTQTLSNSTVKYNQNVLLECSAEGNQPLLYEYYVNNVLIPGDAINHNFTRSQEIKCIAKNDFGNATSIAYITVIGGNYSEAEPNNSHPWLHRCVNQRLPDSCVPFQPHSDYWWQPVPVKSVFDIDGQLRLLFNYMDRTAQKESENSQQPAFHALCSDRLKRLICSQMFLPCSHPMAEVQTDLSPTKLAICQEHCQIIEEKVCTIEVWKKFAAHIVDNFPKLSATRLKPLLEEYQAGSCKQLRSFKATSNHTPLPDGNVSCLPVDLEPFYNSPQESGMDCYWPGGSVTGYMDVSKMPYYMGQAAHTQCLPWNTVQERSPLFHYHYFPSLRNLDNSSNVCRNPGHIASAPFCFIHQPESDQLKMVSCNGIIKMCNPLPFIPITTAEINPPAAASMTNIMIILIVVIFVVLLFALWFIVRRQIKSCRCAKANNILSILLFCRCPLMHGNLSAVEMQGVPGEHDRDPVRVTSKDEYRLKQCLTQSYAPRPDESDLHPQLQALEYSRNEVKEIAQLGKGIFGDVFLVYAPSLPSRERLTSFTMATTEASSSSISSLQDVCSSHKETRSNEPSVVTTDDNNATHEDAHPHHHRLHSPPIPLSNATLPANVALHENKNTMKNQVAMKVLREDAEPWIVESFLHEAELLVQFHHPNVISLLGVCLLEKPFCLLQDYMNYGDLNTFLKRCRDVHPNSGGECNGIAAGENDRLLVNAASNVTGGHPSHHMIINRERKLHLALQIAKGMMYISSKGFVHRDLATRNCLLNSCMRVKISDFMLCVSVQTGVDYVADISDKAPFRWLSPESIFHRCYNLDTDVWSFGVLLWEIFTMGEQPYTNQTPEEVKTLLMHEECLPQPLKCDDAVYKLMRECWHFDRTKRPTFSYLVEKLKALSKTNRSKIVSTSVPV